MNTTLIELGLFKQLILKKNLTTLGMWESLHSLNMNVLNNHYNSIIIPQEPRVCYCGHVCFQC